ncbi:hypothetical protein K2173_020513 [Erythroxylum novogranatense]|uniref:Uncharacterized protein n=1 Tax=Erythroxylum novogranatense TaxID=1862640 RepID=A0AAV8TGJ6_9ROSI|nr:hypothetical protein K2173_020513 [Erythroxylum novogranatense]
MTHVWLLRWPKGAFVAAATSKASVVDPAAVATANTNTSAGENNTQQRCCCGWLMKIVKKLKKQGRMLRAATTNRQSSFQCRYDPLSYSLNFDTSERGSLLDDEDYYQFCAFSSRFVANPRANCQRIVFATSH